MGKRSHRACPTPSPEPVKVEKLPLPLTAPSDDPGACGTAVNPHRTGCIATDWNTLHGGFTPDGRDVNALVTFTRGSGRPGSGVRPHREAVRPGQTDDTLFPKGDPWTCLTCPALRTARGPPVRSADSELIQRSPSWPEPSRTRPGTGSMRHEIAPER
ncbi:hypothetical protein GCM10010306_092440 [Streptomyces umbrinus]|nr:hypothetical protein GCM10010306_092440 [Streptomyces umbrinus]